MRESIQDLMGALAQLDAEMTRTEGQLAALNARLQEMVELQNEILEKIADAD